jgi:PhzF family phenazine biosynthesis protein
MEAVGLSDTEMQMIAREKNLSETAFVLPATLKAADLQIRWFTPANEVPLCGHATIASFHALAEEGMHGMGPQGQHYFRLQTKSGILSVRVEKNFQGITVEFELPLPNLKVRKSLDRALTCALGLKMKDLDRRFPIVSESYVYVPVKKLSSIRNLKPEMSSVLNISKKAKVLGISVFTLETEDKASSVHSRFFAPSVGINEDPVTGSANGPLGAYLFKEVMPKNIQVPNRQLSDGRIEFVGEQGTEMGRPGLVKTRLLISGAAIRSLSIAGDAVTVLNSTIIL